MSEADRIRRDMIKGGQPQQDLAVEQGPRWTTDELGKSFEVVGFAAPYVVVRRRADGVRGTLEFTHAPRVYFNFQPE